MFDVRRLADALSPLGFFVACQGETETWFARAGVRRHLFEVIDVNAGRRRGGRWGDIASAGISIALTPGQFTSLKGMAEAECLSDWSPTKPTEQAAAWERAIVESAPARLDALARARGPALLDRTADARAAVDGYLSLLDRRRSVGECIAALSEGATPAELREARRLGRTEGLVRLPERACYDLISLLIARYAGRVEGDPERFWGKSPNSVPELNWRIQLLASRLYPERGWESVGK